MTDPLEREAFAIHEAMMAWLKTRYPRAHPLSVLTACTYEIGRVVGTIAKDTDMPATEIDAMLDNVRATMRQQIDAVRAGLDR